MPAHCSQGVERVRGGDMGGVLPLRGFRCVWIGGNRVSLGIG